MNIWYVVQYVMPVYKLHKKYKRELKKSKIILSCFEKEHLSEELVQKDIWAFVWRAHIEVDNSCKKSYCLKRSCKNWHLSEEPKMAFVWRAKNTTYLDWNEPSVFSRPQCQTHVFFLCLDSPPPLQSRHKETGIEI